MRKSAKKQQSQVQTIRRTVSSRNVTQDSGNIINIWKGCRWFYRQCRRTFCYFLRPDFKKFLFGKLHLCPSIHRPVPIDKVFCTRCMLCLLQICYYPLLLGALMPLHSTAGVPNLGYMYPWGCICLSEGPTSTFKFSSLTVAVWWNVLLLSTMIDEEIFQDETILALQGRYLDPISALKQPKGIVKYSGAIPPSDLALFRLVWFTGRRRQYHSWTYIRFSFPNNSVPIALGIYLGL